MTRNDLLYYGLLEAVRCWWAGDNALRHQVGQSGFDLDLLEHIAAEFKVLRNLPDRMRATVMNKMNDLSHFKDRDLSERAEELCKIAAKLVEKFPASKEDDGKKTVTHLPISALTKLSWFAAPDNWTMFDRLAANGAGIRKDLSAPDRAKRFYETLKDAHFHEKCASIAQRLNEQTGLNVHPTRVIDKYLMQRGSVKRNDGFLEAWLTGLPGDLSVQVKDAATAIATDKNCVMEFKK